MYYVHLYISSLAFLATFLFISVSTFSTSALFFSFYLITRASPAPSSMCIMLLNVALSSPENVPFILSLILITTERESLYRGTYPFHFECARNHLALNRYLGKLRYVITQSHSLALRIPEILLVHRATFTKMREYAVYGRIFYALKIGTRKWIDRFVDRDKVDRDREVASVGRAPVFNSRFQSLWMRSLTRTLTNA